MVKIRLSRLLGDKRITRKELSEMTGIRPNTISDWYNEVTDRINLEHLDRICEALDCSIPDVLARVQSPIKKTGKSLIKD